MEVNFSFIYRIALLTSLAFQVQSTEEVLGCAETGGTCVSKDLCQGFMSLSNCPDEEVCCRMARSDQCRGLQVPRECEASYEGVCQTDCEDGRIETGVCEGDCKCCGCKISDECLEASGHCITRGDECNGKAIPDWCDGEFCACCVSPLDEN